jgi:hypothetical protein
VDVFDPSLGTPPVQLHDLNPGIQADGLFWTTAIPPEGVHVNLRRGEASLEATDVPITDFGTIANALAGESPTGTPGTVSFKVVWQGVDERFTVRNDDPPTSGGSFAGEFIRTTAQMEWRATVGDVLLVSDVLATSSSMVAEIGHEQNGIFFA